MEKVELFILRQWDFLDGWIDIAGPVTRAEAERLWNEYTGNGTHHAVESAGHDYYKIFPANTRMIFTPELLGR